MVGNNQKQDKPVLFIPLISSKKIKTFLLLIFDLPMAQRSITGFVRVYFMLWFRAYYIQNFCATLAQKSGTKVDLRTSNRLLVRRPTLLCRNNPLNLGRLHGVGTNTKVAKGNTNPLATFVRKSYSI